MPETLVDGKLLTPDDEESLIASLLDRGFVWLHFPGDLEERYRLFHRHRAIRTIQFSAFYVVIFAMVVGVAAFAFINPNELRLWGVGYLGMVVSLGSVVILVNQPALERYQQIYTGFFACIALISFMTITLFLEDVQLRQFGSYQVMYVLFVIYTVARLRFVAAISTSFMAGAFVILLSFVTENEIDWMQFNMYYLFANIICAVVNYLLEHNERSLFLQSRLLELEKGRLNRLSKQLTVMSREDALTKLANRRHFDEVYHHEWNRCRRDRVPLSILLIDVDFFKDYNDYYGHIRGDDCLSKVAETLSQQAYRTSDFVARYGGEEFVMVCPNTNLASARLIAQRIIESVDALEIEHETSLVSKYITVSVGIGSSVPSSEHDYEELVQVADRALYKAKGAGRHQAHADQLN